MTHPDHACAARAGPDGSAATGLLFTCAQGVIDDPAALLAASTSSTPPSALGTAETLHAVSTPCWAGAAARASVDTSRHDTVRPSAVTEVPRTPLTATEAPLTCRKPRRRTGPTAQPVMRSRQGGWCGRAPAPPKVAPKTARCVPAAPAGPAAAEHVPTVEAVAAAEPGGPPPAAAADAHAQPRLQAAGIDERARPRAHEHSSRARCRRRAPRGSCRCLAGTGAGASHAGRDSAGNQGAGLGSRRACPAAVGTGNHPKRNGRRRDDQQLPEQRRPPHRGCPSGMSHEDDPHFLLFKFELERRRLKAW